MDNKDFEEKNENLAEEVTEAAEEAAEEAVEEAAEEVAEEVSEAAEEITEAVEEQAAELSEEAESVFEAAEIPEQPVKKPMGKAGVAVITAIITAIVSVFCTLVAVGKLPQIYNKYNKGINVTGRTVKEIAEARGITTAKLLSEYDLPADMPAETTETAVYYRMTLKDIADMNKLSVDDIKEQLALGEDVTEDANWVTIEDGLTLGQYIGEDDFEEFKTEYGLGKGVTLETKFKSVRSKVYNAMKKSGKNSDKDFNIVVKYSVLYNKYNNMGYLDVEGSTVSDLAEKSGMELAEFLSEYGLPEDMPGNTSLNAAQNLAPIGILAGGEEGFAEIKDKLGLDDSVTMDTPWGEALKNVKLKNYVGEENFENFKEEYGLGEEVTLDTTWEEVRPQVEAKQKEMYDAQK